MANTTILLCAMIPDCIKIPKVPFGVLPPGIHWASFSEIRARFGQTSHRAQLLEGIERVAAALRVANCKRMFLDGSFVTEKSHPRDFNGCWDAADVYPALLDPVLLDFDNGRAAQKRKFYGEMFVLRKSRTGTNAVLDFFQREKLTGAPKGIVGVDLNKRNGAPQ